MTRRARTSTSFSRAAVSLLLLLVSMSTAAQSFLRFEADSVPMMRGFAVMVDVVGPMQLQFSDYGQYEAGLKLNLHDQYFPTFEAGYGKAVHEDDEVTGITYLTKAPYFRIGADVNLLKNKHSGNRLFAGFRYAFTYYSVDLERQPFPDPVWLSPAGFSIKGDACNMHWAEVVFGIDAKVFGPLHLGWSVRYRNRLFGKDGSADNTWYVPGFGKNGTTRIGATFNIIIDI